MTVEHYWKAIGRSLTDPTFSKALHDDPDETLRGVGYDLNASQLADALSYEMADGSRPGLDNPSEDYWLVIGRLLVDDAFANALHRDADEAIEREGYSVSREEFLDALSYARPEEGSGDGRIPPRVMPPLESKEDRAQRLEGQKFAIDLLKQTLQNAKRTFQLITWMNAIMFGVGILLFVSAAAYAAAFRTTASIIFGGLGVATFVTLFLTGPIEKSQVALSNLVQVQILFLGFQEQATYWQGIASTANYMPPEDAKAILEDVSDGFQARMSGIVGLLQKYVEPPARAAAKNTPKGGA
jgi:hypothetical protein